MKGLEETKKIINENKPFLKERFKVKSISLFGSYVWEEQDKDSDIDILVEFDSVIDLFEFIRLENFLSEVLAGRFPDGTRPRNNHQRRNGG